MIRKARIAERKQAAYLDSSCARCGRGTLTRFGPAGLHYPECESCASDIKRRERHDRKAIAERWEAIDALRLSGATWKATGAAFGISTARVKQIVWQIEKRRGAAGRIAP